MKKTMKALALLLALVFCMSVFAGCSSNSSSASSGAATPNIDAIKAKGTFVFGTESTYPPFQFTIMVDGKAVYTGTDVDLAKKVAEKLGVEYVQSEMAFDSLIPALQAGTIDMAGSMTPTPERDEVIDFSVLYCEAVNRFIVRKAEADSFSSAESFKDKTIGAQLGTVQNTMVVEDMTDSKNLILPKVSTLVQELKTGNIDAICVEGPVADCYVAAYPDELAVASYQVVNEGDGVAMTVNEGASDLLALVNELLEELIASGEMQQIYDANVKLAIDQIVND